MDVQTLFLPRCM